MGDGEGGEREKRVKRRDGSVDAGQGLRFGLDRSWSFDEL